VKKEDIRVSITGDVLSIDIPKAVEVKPKEIEVKVK
jgi:HSP20 family molecular chaperone IbpA